MTISLIDSQIYDILTEHTVNTNPHLLENRDDQIFLYPDWLGSGYKRAIELRNGIYITIHNYQLSQDVVNDCRNCNADCLEFVFNLSPIYQKEGKSLIKNSYHYLCGVSDKGYIWKENSHKQALAVDIHLSPTFLKSYFDENETIISEHLKSFLEGSNKMEISSSQTMSSYVQTVTKQIINCPYYGMTKQLYLEGKSLELIALHLETLTQKSSSNLSLKKQDKEAIYYAKEILVSSYNDPPNLTTLARKVGLNTRKLKEGFRYIFNNTVFGYLREYRLQMAKNLLAEEKSITVVASMVGYASPSAFTIAFQKQFGVNPKTYQMTNISSNNLNGGLIR